jgi:glycosyltransferase involved in cell wall biosynthesis
MTGVPHPSAGAPESLSYVIISPVKDESRYIEKTILSVLNQSVKPTRWIIVDDGSTDGTPEIVERHAAVHPFIELLRTRQAGARDTGTAEAMAFCRGYRAVAEGDHGIVVKLDGDLSFDRLYFESLLQRFDADPRLGIASGVYLEQDRSGAWKIVGMPAYHACGACKVVRRQCFDEIGGFDSRPGWDTADEIRAWSRGWRTSHFADLEVRHHKPEGAAMGSLRTSRMYGEIHYVTGGDPFFLMLKLFHRACLKPVVVGALAQLFGYVAAAVQRKPLLVAPHEAAGYRRRLRQRVWSFARSPFHSNGLSA